MKIDQLPPEVFELIIDRLFVHHLSTSRRWDPNDDIRNTRKLEYPEPSLVAPYRLISRAFCEAASPLFYASLAIRFYPKSGNEDDILRPLARFAELITCERRSKYVRQLNLAVHNIDFSSYRKGSNVTHFYNYNRRAGSQVRMSVDRVVESLQDLFPKACAAFGGLRSLEFRGPHCGFDLDAADGEQTTEDEQPTEAALVMQDIVAQGMANLASRHLADLKLDLPCTQGISSAMSGPTLSHLRDLHFLELRVTDDSGPWGSRFGIERMINDDDEQRGYPFSELQKLLPNQSAANQDFLRNFDAFPGLRELKLYGSNYLNLDLMQSAFTTLRSLNLHRIWSGEVFLVTLINQVAPTVKAMNLEEVELTQGTWEDCFVAALQCAELEYLIVCACGYAPDAQSSRYRCLPHRPWESLTEVESDRQEDECALGDLQRMVAQRRNKLGYGRDRGYDDSATSHVDEMPLAEWKASQLMAAQ